MKKIIRIKEDINKIENIQSRGTNRNTTYASEIRQMVGRYYEKLYADTFLKLR